MKSKYLTKWGAPEFSILHKRCNLSPAQAVERAAALRNVLLTEIPAHSINRHSLDNPFMRAGVRKLLLTRHVPEECAEALTEALARLESGCADGQSQG